MLWSRFLHVLSFLEPDRTNRARHVTSSMEATIPQWQSLAWLLSCWFPCPSSLQHAGFAIAIQPSSAARTQPCSEPSGSCTSGSSLKDTIMACSSSGGALAWAREVGKEKGGRVIFHASHPSQQNARTTLAQMPVHSVKQLPFKLYSYACCYYKKGVKMDLHPREMRPLQWPRIKRNKVLRYRICGEGVSTSSRTPSSLSSPLMSVWRSLHRYPQLVPLTCYEWTLRFSSMTVGGHRFLTGLTGSLPYTCLQNNSCQ